MEGGNHLLHIPCAWSSSQSFLVYLTRKARKLLDSLHTVQFQHHVYVYYIYRAAAGVFYYYLLIYFSRISTMKQLIPVIFFFT